MSENGSRPAHLEEFARKLAAAVAEQADAGKTRLRLVRSRVNVEVSSSRSADAALAPGSMGKYQPAKIDRPSSETHETGTHFSSPQSKRDLPQGDSAHEPEKVSASATGDVYASQPAASHSNLSETSSAGRALKSSTSPAVAQAFPRGTGNGPRQEIGAAPGSVDSKARYTVDLEKLLADTEALPANDTEVAQVVEPANLRARPQAEAIKRFSRSWKQIASAGVLVSVAVAGATTLAHSLLAVPKAPPQAYEPIVSETIMRDDSAQEAPKARPLEPSSAVEDRLGDNSGSIGATVGVPQANETPGAGATQATIGLKNEAPSGSMPEASQPTGPASPLVPPAQPSGYKPVPANRTATVSSSLVPPAQSSNPKPAPSPTASRQLAPTPTSSMFPTEGSSADHTPQPTAKPARNVDNVGTAKISARRSEMPTKVVGKPSIRARVTKNDATSTTAVTEKSNKPLPVGTPANSEKGVIASNLVRSPPAADPGASDQQPLDHTTHAGGRGVPLAADPAASDQQLLDHLRHAIGDIFATRTAPAQHAVDPTPPRGD